MSQISVWATTAILVLMAVSYAGARIFAGKIRESLQEGRIARIDIDQTKQRLRMIEQLRRFIGPFGTTLCLVILYIFR